MVLRDPFIGLCILWSSFACSAQSTGYAENFLEAMHSSGIEVRADSLILVPGGEAEAIRIPTTLKLDSLYLMRDDHGQVLRLRRINYTDIEFSMSDLDGISIDGRATLQPTFYLGMESPGTSEGEFWAYSYNIVYPKFECLKGFAIGDQSITESEPMPPYTYIYFEGNCTEGTIKFSRELWKSGN